MAKSVAALALAFWTTIWLLARPLAVPRLRARRDDQRDHEHEDEQGDGQDFPIHVHTPYWMFCEPPESCGRSERVPRHDFVWWVVA